MRWIALALVAVIYFAIVAAHQLTPYMALLGVAALVVLGVVWRGWLTLRCLRSSRSVTWRRTTA